MEIWKDVSGYEGLYKVSDEGRVMCIATCFRNVKPGNFLKTTPQKNGYGIVRLWKDKKPKSFYVHRLVAAAFLGECPPKHEVNHKNGLRLHNQAANLEYVTRSENNFHSYRVLHRQPAPTYGEKHHNAKLNQEKVGRMRYLFARLAYSYADLAREFHVHWTTARSVVNYETWKPEHMK
jgi:hypothetical protein